jgi:hypothetical protein
MATVCVSSVSRSDNEETVMLTLTIASVSLVVIFLVVIHCGNTVGEVSAQRPQDFFESPELGRQRFNDRMTKAEVHSGKRLIHDRNYGFDRPQNAMLRGMNVDLDELLGLEHANSCPAWRLLGWFPRRNPVTQLQRKLSGDEGNLRPGIER